MKWNYSSFLWIVSGWLTFEVTLKSYKYDPCAVSVGCDFTCSFSDGLFTGLHQERKGVHLFRYFLHPMRTPLWLFCPHAYICAFLLFCGVRIECQRSLVYALSACVHHRHRTIEMHICMRTKQSKWCAHWVQEIPKQVYALSWCKPVYCGINDRLGCQVLRDFNFSFFFGYPVLTIFSSASEPTLFFSKQIKAVTVLEHTCANAQWAHMHHFLSVCLSVCLSFHQNSLNQNSPGNKAMATKSFGPHKTLVPETLYSFRVWVRG